MGLTLQGVETNLDRDDLVVATDLSRVIGSGATAVRVLDHVSLRVPRLSLFAIDGPSGSGKSTLLNLLTGIDRPTSSEVVFDGRYELFPLHSFHCSYETFGRGDERHNPEEQ